MNGVNHFLESVMRGMRGGVIVVNRDLHVIAWNQRSEEMWGLRAGEVRNKNVFGLDIGLPIEQLRHTILACRNGDRDVRDVTVDATNRRGRPVQCKVTCTPLLGTNETRGVIVMVDELTEISQTA